MPESFGPVSQDQNPSDWGGEIPVEQEPYAPTDVKVQRVGTGTIKVTWKDPFARQFGSGGFRRNVSESPFGTWSIRYTSQDIAGASAGNTEWAQFVLAASRELGNRRAGSPGLLQFLYTDADIRNGWIIIVGVTDSGSNGPPSNPVFAAFENTSIPAPPSLTDAGGNLSFVEDTSIGDDPVMQITLVYVPPSDTSGFLGVQPHLKGFDGSTELIEVGFHHWDRSPGDQLYQFRYVADPGVGDLNVDLTNGLTSAGFNSGDTIQAGWANNWAIVYDPSGTFWTTVIIDTVSAPLSFDLFSPWTGLTGAYDVRVLNPMSIFMVPVSTTGNRTDDPESEFEIQFGT